MLIRTLLVIFVLVALIGTLATANGNTALRDLSWGDTIAHDHFRLIGEDTNDLFRIIWYARNDDNYDLGYFKAKEIRYGFLEGKLVCILFELADVGGAYDMLKQNYTYLVDWENTYYQEPGIENWLNWWGDTNTIAMHTISLVDREYNDSTELQQLLGLFQYSLGLTVYEETLHMINEFR